MAFMFEQAIALVVPFLLGLLVGYILKQSIKILVAVAIIILILLAIGAINISVLEYGFKHILAYGVSAIEAAKAVAAVLPFSSILFIIGLAIGFLLSK
ncbi:MAG: hypothetical protein RQ952_01970 [Thermoproteota archaeon]|jgi:uncharacterized membrane protein (Fun14 family)|nr:hypothetical protein [Thermoproteota archaeon]